jgi:hypothetical protein
MNFREALYNLSRNISDFGGEHSAKGGEHLMKGWKHCTCELAAHIRQLEESRLKIYADLNDYEADHQK